MADPNATKLAQLTQRVDDLTVRRLARTALPVVRAASDKALPPSWSFVPIRDNNGLIVEIVGTPIPPEEKR